MSRNITVVIWSSIKKSQKSNYIIDKLIVKKLTLLIHLNGFEEFDDLLN